MKSIFTLIFCVAATVTFAQNTPSGGCGTMTPQSEVSRIYDFVQHNPQAYAARSAGVVDSIPLAIHNVGSDAGTGYYNLSAVFQLICQLNDRYTPVGFHFYIKWPLHYIPNSSYNVHDFNTGDYMMRQNNIANAVNVYLVQDPAGNCGYYTYNADGVAISKGCAGNNTTTLTHELGHFFSLPHTFYGWEWGTPANPEAVRRSGPGTNCTSAGDGFCDTYADFIATRWSCPSPTNKTDVFGDQYHLDSSIYMSYSLDACQSRFSSQQIAAMQYNLRATRQSYPGAVIPAPRALDTARIVYPADTFYANVRKAIWRKIPGADYYYVRLAYQSAPTSPLQSILTADTTLDITLAMVDEGEYVFYVSPVNAHDVCMRYGKAQPFVFTNRHGNVGIQPLPAGGDGVQVYPTLLRSGDDLRVAVQSAMPGIYTATLCAANGQTMATRTFSHNGRSAEAFRTSGYPDGIYFLRWRGPGGQGAVRIRIGQ